MSSISSKLCLLESELKAKRLFKEVLKLKLIEHGKTEQELSSKVFDLAFKMFGVKDHWHKRIVRTGANTIYPYNENPPNLTIERDDILFFDFGPVFNSWEADLGRTYVLGNNKMKLKMKDDVEECWYLGKKYYDSKEEITSSELYKYIASLATNRSWEFGNEHCGHLIGKFPHERISGEKYLSYIHPNNHMKMRKCNNEGNVRDWVLEIHFVDYNLSIGGFYEQVLTFDRRFF